MAAAQQLQGAAGVAGIDPPRQLADAAVAGEAVAVGQQHHGIAQARTRVLHGYLLAGDARQVGRRRGVQPASFAEFGEHGAGFHRRQLVLVAQQDQPRIGRQGVEQLGHQRQVDHGGFVHHQHIQRQRVVGVVAYLRAVAAAAQQAVQGARLLGQRGLDGFAHRQLGLGVADRLGHARGGLAGGRGETDGQALAARLLQQPREQAHHGGGLASAGAAGDHRQVAPYRLGGGQALPIRLLGVTGEEPRQGFGQLRLVHLRPRAGPLQQAFGQLRLVGVVTAEIEASAVQGQGRITARRRHQGRGLQGIDPGGQGGSLDAGAAFREQQMPGHSRQGQADIAIAQGLAAECGGGQDRLRRLWIEALQALGEMSLQRPKGPIGEAHQRPSSNSRSSASSRLSAGRWKNTPASGMPRRNR
ncbi:hypothetical protein D3C84_264210 [compost metagenome]